MSAHMRKELQEHESKFGAIEETKDQVRVMDGKLKLHLEHKAHAGQKASCTHVDTPTSP